MQKARITLNILNNKAKFEAVVLNADNILGLVINCTRINTQLRFENLGFHE